MTTRATCSNASPRSASPNRSAFSAAGVLGPQSNSVTGPASKAYTLAGPTRYGVGTTIRWARWLGSGNRSVSTAAGSGLNRGVRRRRAWACGPVRSRAGPARAASRARSGCTWTGVCHTPERRRRARPGTSGCAWGARGPGALGPPGSVRPSSALSFQPPGHSATTAGASVRRGPLDVRTEEGGRSFPNGGFWRAGRLLPGRAAGGDRGRRGELDHPGMEAQGPPESHGLLVGHERLELDPAHRAPLGEPGRLMAQGPPP